MNLGLKGKVALVTGSGLGNGRGIIKLFAAEGCNVIVNDLAPNSEQRKKWLDAHHRGSLEELVGKEMAQRMGQGIPPGEATAMECRQMGVEAEFIPANVTNYGEVKEMIRKGIERFGKIDILVNNAGGAVLGERTFVESNPESWDYTVRLCYFGVLNCTHAVLPHMIERKQGAICSILSDAWKGADVGLAVYGGAKAAISSVSRTIAKEVGRYGVRLNCASPGGSNVEWSQEGRRRQIAQMGEEAYNERQTRVLNQYALGRFRGGTGSPEDLGRMVVFLCSPACEWVTGQTVSVSGGYHMHQ